MCRVTIGTWNVAGRQPYEDLDIDDWLCTQEPADIYIIGCVFHTLVNSERSLSAFVMAVVSICPSCYSVSNILLEVPVCFS